MNDDDVVLPLIAYHATARRFVEPEIETLDTEARGSRFSGYADCLSPAAAVRRLFILFKSLTLKAYRDATPPPELVAIRNAINICMQETDADSRGPKWQDVEYDLDHDRLQGIFTDGRILPFGQLSDGQRTQLALVADLALRSVILNPQFGADAPTRTPGIVLIDELDLHLHPFWQRRVVHNLTSAFPALQFIATTHSPFIVQSLGPNQLIVLDPRGQEEPDEGAFMEFQAEAQDFRTMSIEDITEFVFGVNVPQRSRHLQEMYDTAQQYHQLLKQADSASEAKKSELKAKLDALTARFSDDVAYHAFLEMERIAAGLGD